MKPLLTKLRYRMQLILVLMLAFPAGPVSLGAQGQRQDERSAWEHSIVTLEVARKQYDYYQPWSKGTRRLQKAGLVAGPREVLTTADELFERTLVRLQKGGRGRWWIGEVKWVDYQANLALVTTSEPDFWRDLKPATLGRAAPTEGPMHDPALARGQSRRPPRGVHPVFSARGTVEPDQPGRTRESAPTSKGPAGANPSWSIPTWRGS